LLRFHSGRGAVRRAFTLIELLVVIAIIAILAAILFPVFASAKEAAKKTACISNHKQLAMSTIMYMSDSDGTAPIGVGFNRPSWVLFFVHDLTSPYRKNKDLLTCPTYPNSAKGADYTGDGTTYTGSLFQYIRTRCSSCIPARTFRYNAYTWNMGVFGIALDPSPFGFARRYWPINESSIPEPVDTIAYSDGYLPRRYNSTETYGGWVDYWFKWEIWPRHTDGQAFSFMDGHVKYYKHNGFPKGGRVVPGCTNYFAYSSRPTYYDWKVRVSAARLQACGIKDYPKTEAQHECVPHPGSSPNFGDMHGVPGTCVADINN
jgi:prepilin-type N-terminal cleavage/methylation domain-containing protein